MSVEPDCLARLAEHAEQAGDADAVLEFAPAAGDTASRLGSHRQAAFQYARALRFAGRLSARERAALLEKQANECTLIDQRDEAVVAWHEANELWDELGDQVRAGDCWRQLACTYINAGRRADSERAAKRAIEMLEPLGPGPELAWAYAEQCALAMLESDPAALTWGEKALALAEKTGPPGGVRARPLLHRRHQGHRW